MDEIDSVMALFEVVTDRYHKSLDVGSHMQLINESLNTIAHYLDENVHDIENPRSSGLQMAGYWLYRVQEWQNTKE